MQAVKIAARTTSFRQPLRKALHTTASVGCVGVEIDALAELKPRELSDTGARQLRKMLDDLDLRVAAVVFPNRRGFSDARYQQARVDAALDAMRMAARLRCRTLLVNVHDAEEPGPVAQSLEVLAARGLRDGVQLVGRGGSLAPDVLARLAGSLPEHGLLLDVDPGKIVAAGASPAEYLRALGPLLGTFHATDAVRDIASGGGLEVQLGRGSVDYPELLGVLEEVAYDGWVTLARDNSNSPTEDMADAVKFLEAIIRG